MPALTNPKHEACCQARAMGKPVGEAYVAGGYKYTSASPTQFFQRPDIVERVQEIIGEKYEVERKAREIAPQEAGIDAAWIYKRLKYLTDISLQKREIKRDGAVVGNGAMDGPTAIRCLTLAAQMSGQLVNRHEVGQPGDFARMSDAELDSALLEQARALGISDEAIGRLVEPQTIQ